MKKLFKSVIKEIVYFKKPLIGLVFMTLIILALAPSTAKAESAGLGTYSEFQ